MMEKPKELAAGKNYTAVDAGRLEDLGEYSFLHPLNKQQVTGKVFLKEATHATGTEISLQMLPAGQELSYFHIHRQNEETYLFLKGRGMFQVDEDCFPVREGSVVRVAPAGARSLRNDADGPMVYMVIQSRENSLLQYSSGDGERVAHEPCW